MNQDITLVILAAGMGSRFGGLKQIAPMGPNDEFIIDYSVYDAIEAGFTKIVFLIKEENYEIFKETIGARVEPHIPVEYCFQKNDNLPEGYIMPEDRVKPLGTAHAILCCENAVHEPFMIINADVNFTNLDFGAVCRLHLKGFPQDIFVACNQPTEVREVKIQHYFAGVGNRIIVECRLIIKLDDIIRNAKTKSRTLVIESGFYVIQIIVPFREDSGDAVADFGHTYIFADDDIVIR